MLDFSQIALVLELAEQASDIILSFHEKIEVTPSKLKSDHSPLSHADLASNEILVAGLRQVLNVPVVSEENAHEFSPPVSFETYWLIDPLDGTKGFLKKNGEFAINIALIDNNIPVFGVISVPIEQRHYTALLGAGCHIQNYRAFNTRRALRVEDLNFHNKVSLIVSRDFTHHDQLRIEQMLGPVETQVIGSSIKFCRIAEGRANLYLRLTPSCEWDIAPGIVMLKEAGCNILDLKGNELSFNKDSYFNPSFVAFTHRKTVIDCGILQS